MYDYQEIAIYVCLTQLEIKTSRFTVDFFNFSFETSIINFRIFSQNSNPNFTSILLSSRQTFLKPNKVDNWGFVVIVSSILILWSTLWIDNFISVNWKDVKG